MRGKDQTSEGVFFFYLLSRTHNEVPTYTEPPPASRVWRGSVLWDPLLFFRKREFPGTNEQLRATSCCPSALVWFLWCNAAK